MQRRFKRTWILVADACRARIFSHHQKEGYRVVKELDHPESRAHVSALVADTNGRKSMGVPGGGYGHPGVAPDTDAKEVEHEKFARLVAEALERGHFDSAFEDLVLVAPPHFLGLVKSALADPVARKVVETLSKDISQLADHQVIERLHARHAA